MFDLTSSKLLILGIVALIVVGPKELPFLLRTIGKYMGMLRRHANEFRAQFDEAMREAELDSIKKDLEGVARDAENTIRSAQSSFENDMHATTKDLDHTVQQVGQQSGEQSGQQTGQSVATTPVETGAYIRCVKWLGSRPRTSSAARDNCCRCCRASSSSRGGAGAPSACKTNFNARAVATNAAPGATADAVSPTGSGARTRQDRGLIHARFGTEGVY